jgi:hypothetical protein
VLTEIFPFISVSNYLDFIPILMTFLLRIEKLALFFTVIHENLTFLQKIAVSRSVHFCLQSAV